LTSVCAHGMHATMFSPSQGIKKVESCILIWSAPTSLMRSLIFYLCYWPWTSFTVLSSSLSHIHYCELHRATRTTPANGQKQFPLHSVNIHT
jgi:hypothetical protein